MVRTALCTVAASVAALLAPASAAGPDPAVTLSHGSFVGTSRMSCSGYPVRTCTHVWDATTCFEAVGDAGAGVRGCDARTATPSTTIHNRTRGTAHWSASTGYTCTTTNLNTDLVVVVLVESRAFGTTDVAVVTAQTNGAGTFHGSRTLAGWTVTVDGSYNVDGADGGPCGTGHGSLAGTFTVRPPT